MNLKILEQKDEPLLSRKEIKAELTFEGTATPSNDTVKKAIAKNLKADEKLVVVKSIYTTYGTNNADVNAYVYASEKEMTNIEPKKKD